MQFEVIEVVSDFRITAGKLVVETNGQFRPRPGVLLGLHGRSLLKGGIRELPGRPPSLHQHLRYEARRDKAPKGGAWRTEKDVAEVVRLLEKCQKARILTNSDTAFLRGLLAQPQDSHV